MSGRYWAVVPAAGAGRRMASAVPKQYLPLAGSTVIERTLGRLLDHPAIAGVWVALSPEDGWWGDLPLASDLRVMRVAGGAERSDSVLQALRAMEGRVEPGDWVLVHDAARPCVRRCDLDLLINELREEPVGGLLGSPLHDTVKRVASGGEVLGTVPRSELWRAFTPQMFRYRLLRESLESAVAQGVAITDDASAMELAGHRFRMIEGAPDNIKITRPEDLELAEYLLRRQVE